MREDQTHQIFKESFQLFGLILQTESHPLPHLGGCADDPSPHDGSDILYQDAPVHLTHQRLSITHNISPWLVTYSMTFKKKRHFTETCYTPTSCDHTGVTWYGGESIRLNFLKWCLMLASMASKASVLFSHFLFISLSKKGWNDRTFIQILEYTFEVLVLCTTLYFCPPPHISRGIYCTILSYIYCI